MRRGRDGRVLGWAEGRGSLLWDGWVTMETRELSQFTSIAMQSRNNQSLQLCFKFGPFCVCFKNVYFLLLLLHVFCEVLVYDFVFY